VDLVTWLASQASQVATPLDVTVTGHSKAAALAQAVALWLREALDVPPERWDAGRGARVHCYAFAGPTPGNAAFARRFEAALGATHHHVRNMNDIITHAWQPDELRQIPALYGSRTALFKPVIDTIVATTESLIRRPPRRCARGRGLGRERRDTLGGARVHQIGLRAREYAHTSPRNPATPDT